MRIDLSGLALEKGDIVDNSTIARLSGVDQRSSNFCFAKMTVARAIEMTLTQEKRVASLKIRLDGIHILTDAAAVIHNRRLNKSAKKKVNKAAKQILAVDVGALTAIEREEHHIVLQSLLNDRRALRDSRDIYDLLGPPEGSER